ncbi:MAG: hypothetical protein D3909_00270 [Candidatus Electrothrix sp. ATG1]|nr:hypothetical protein [Candidatus Electrothrix sp. ATG1]MCI5208100.1 hypothetical protein [Candidatus Electrothrix sp. ATG2]
MKLVNLKVIMYVSPSNKTQRIPEEFFSSYRENTKNIILAASSIENLLAEGIIRYFFGNNISKRNILNNLVISSDSFTFSSKRKAFLSIVREQKIISNAEVNKLEKLLAKTIRYRNLFTHGKAVFSESGCVLRYFEGEKRELVLDDEFLNKVEGEMNSCFDKIDELKGKISEVVP